MKSGEFNRECCELEEKLSELSKLWQSKLENDKYSEEELKGVFLSYFGEDIRIDNKTIMEQNIGFNQTFVTDLRQCVCENDIKILLKKALYTCYDLRVLLSLSKSIYKTWDKNTAWYLNMYNMTKNNIFIFFKKIFSKINPDEAYLLVLKSFPLYKEFNNKEFKPWAGCYEKKIIDAVNSGQIERSKENGKLLKSIEINYDIRRILIGANLIDDNLKTPIFGVIGELKLSFNFFSNKDNFFFINRKKKIR
jgi:hypothetical protein